MNRRNLFVLLPMLFILLLPLFLRRDPVEDNPDLEQLVIISPHSQSIRWEFENAFCRYCREELKREVDIDWRTPGGTTEIMRYLNGGYVSAFRAEWKKLGNEWGNEVESAFLNRRLKKGTASETAWLARQTFLSGNVGVGVDLMFGGGWYDLNRMTQVGLLVPCGVRERHPELLAGDSPIIPQRMSGETWYDPQDRYYGACLSSFGICFNLDRLKDLGYDCDDASALPDSWEDLADPRLFGLVGAADPSKSGSITKCFEMLIQQKMGDTVRARNPQSPAELQAAVSQGWDEALELVRKIGGNARYFTFSASKVPLGVARGDLVAGMCIDFYGRSQAEWERAHVGRETMRYVTPLGGSSVSVDPIGMFRGAPNEELAQIFIDFVLSPEGQKLWNYRRGTPGGTVQYALRRLPVRRDMYGAEHRAQMSDAEAKPFEIAAEFEYHGEWTGRLFGLMRLLIRVMAVDSHPELQDAWGAILAAGGPEKVPEAMAAFRRLPFPLEKAGEQSVALANPETRVMRTREWADFFRAAYKEAEMKAKAAQ